MVQGCFLHGRVVIPESLRQRILCDLHKGHGAYESTSLLICVVAKLRLRNGGTCGQMRCLPRDSTMCTTRTSTDVGLAMQSMAENTCGLWSHEKNQHIGCRKHPFKVDGSCNRSCADSKCDNQLDEDDCNPRTTTSMCS